VQHAKQELVTGQVRSGQYYIRVENKALMHAQTIARKGDGECWLYLYLGIDELAIVAVAAEVINKPHIDAVPDNDSAVDMDWEADIRRGYLDRQEVYSRTQPTKVALFSVGGIDKPHRTNGCCHACGNTKEMLDHQS